MEDNLSTVPLKKSKWRFIWVLPIAVLTFSAMAKVIRLDILVENMANAGMGHMTNYVGYLALLCIAIFLYPKSRPVGFLLVTAYIGGIIAAHWISRDGNPIGILLQVLFWIGAYFEFSHFFRSSLKKSINQKTGRL